MSSIILRALHGITVGQNPINGYINISCLASAYKEATGKRKDPHNWLKTERAQAYISHLSSVTGFPVTDLIVIEQGGISDEQGTWVHPKLAVPFATWLSVEFEFQVAEWIEEWSRTGRNPISPQQAAALPARSQSLLSAQTIAEQDKILRAEFPDLASNHTPPDLRQRNLRELDRIVDRRSHSPP